MEKYNGGQKVETEGLRQPLENIILLHTIFLLACKQKRNTQSLFVYLYYQANQWNIIEAINKENNHPQN